MEIPELETPGSGGSWWGRHARGGGIFHAAALGVQNCQRRGGAAVSDL